MNKKAILCGAATLASALVMASDTPEVSNVTMTQATFGRMVTITYELNNAPNGAVVTLDVETNATGNAWASIGGAAVCNAKGAVWCKVTSADADNNGRYKITWRPDLSWEGHKVDIASGGARARVTAWALDNTPDYMVVDLTATGGAGTERYYPAADFVSGGVTNAEYKTSVLLMRKIMAKDVTWTMGSTPLETQRNAANEAAHSVTLTNNYYIGVYEVTQAQWGLIKPDLPAPSWFDNAACRAMRPVEQVCYNEIRNSFNDPTVNGAYEWPADPNPNSFLGKLRTKTGLDFDLPSEAQWEFAARAGNGDTKWGDGSGIMNAATDANLSRLGRYMYNGGKVQNGSSYDDPEQSCGAEHGTAIVGSYAPNSWGIYDMPGNLWEWCLDWYENDVTAHGGAVNIDPASPSKTLSGASGTYRVIRGSSWRNAASSCRPAFRDYENAWYRKYNFGFRVVCTAGLQ